MCHCQLRVSPIGLADSEIRASVCAVFQIRRSKDAPFAAWDLQSHAMEYQDFQSEKRFLFPACVIASFV